MKPSPFLFNIKLGFRALLMGLLLVAFFPELAAARRKGTCKDLLGTHSAILNLEGRLRENVLHTLASERAPSKQKLLARSQSEWHAALLQIHRVLEQIDYPADSLNALSLYQAKRNLLAQLQETSPTELEDGLFKDQLHQLDLDYLYHAIRTLALSNVPLPNKLSIIMELYGTNDRKNYSRAESLLSNQPNFSEALLSFIAEDPRFQQAHPSQQHQFTQRASQILSSLEKGAPIRSSDRPIQATPKRTYKRVTPTHQYEGLLNMILSDWEIQEKNPQLIEAFQNDLGFFGRFVESELLTDLNDFQRQALRGLYFEGLSIPQLAKILDRPELSVYVRQYEAIQIIKTRLRNYFEGFPLETSDRIEVLLGPSEVPGVESEASRNEIRRRLSQYLLNPDGRITSKEGHALQLYYGLGWSLEQTARAMEIPEGTLKSALHRAVQKLSDLIVDR